MSARVFRRSISIALRSISATFLLIGAAFAAESVTADPVDFRITGQPLDSALNEFARQSDREIFYASDVVDGVYANGVDGKYEPEDALELLLADSGLEYSVTASDTFLVSDQGGDSDSKNLSPAPILMVQNQPQTKTTNSSRQNDEGQTTVVTGRVTDARTGANLRGAKVTIKETGQWISTGSQGRFRFSSLPNGKYTLTVSFLGYADKSEVLAVHGRYVDQEFALRGGNEIEEIVVFGQRSARALALSQERIASNSATVISSDLLGSFGGTTLSDALRRAPGIAFVPNEQTGDGQNIIIRGLAPDFNQVRLNGLRLGDNSGDSRAPDIGGILAESIESVTISKTLLPSQDSNGAGGLVEIETKSPLDRANRFANFMVQREDRGTGFGDESLVSATLSGVFGSNEDFGASVSIQYRDADIINYKNGVQLAFGQYLPLDENGQPYSSPSSIDANTLFPFEPGVDLAYPTLVASDAGVTRLENLTYTTTLEKQINQHTNLRLDVSHSEVNSDDFRLGVRTNTVTRFASFPIPELNGEPRFAFVSGGLVPSLPGAFALTERNAVYNDVEEDNSVISLRGETVSGAWTFNYGAGVSDASNIRPTQLELSVELPFSEVIGNPITTADLVPTVAGNTIGGEIVSIFPAIAPGADARFALPGYTQARFDLLNDIDLFEFNRAATGASRGENERRSLNLSAKRLFDNRAISFVNFGFEIEESESRSAPILGSRSILAIGDALLSEVGLAFAPGRFDRVGTSSRGFDVFTAQSIENFVNDIDSLVSSGALVETPRPIPENGPGNGRAPSLNFAHGDDRSRDVR